MVVDTLILIYLLENKSRGGDKRSKGVHIKSKKKRKLRETGENDEPQKFDLISSENDRDDISFATSMPTYSKACAFDLIMLCIYL